MKELWQICCCFIGGFVFLGGLVVVFTFFSRAWAHIHNKVVNKTPIKEYLVSVFVGIGVMLAFLLVGSSCIFIDLVWKHVSAPPDTVNVYGVQGRIELTGPSRIPIIKK